MHDDTRLTTTNLIAAAAELLEANGYQRVAQTQLDQWPVSNVRLFEDDYGIVVVVVYETWSALSSGWVDVQAALVELMSRYMTSSDAKSWEGYLVLLTPFVPTPRARNEAVKIRYDTSRVRKLVATGDELRFLSDVERALLPLLPLRTDLQLDVRESVLELLPRLLSGRSIPEEAVRAVINAYQEQQPMVERLHAYRGEG